MGQVLGIVHGESFVQEHAAQVVVHHAELRTAEEDALRHRVHHKAVAERKRDAPEEHPVSEQALCQSGGLWKERSEEFVTTRGVMRAGANSKTFR